MRKSPITLQRLAIMSLFAASCFLILLMLWDSAGGPTPLKAGGYRVHVLLPHARGLGQHSDVRVAGVTIGHVISVGVARPTNGRADVLIELKRPFAPLRADASARLRKKSILGESYVALTLGHPKAAPIRDGGTLALARTLRSVEPDEMLESFDPETRRALGIWQQTEGPAIAEHGDDLNAAMETLRPWAVDASQLLAIVHQQGRDVATLLRDGGAITAGLADREQAIQLLARSGDRAFNATGDEAQGLQATFRELPAFERESELTLRRLTALANRRTGDVRTLAGQLRPFSSALRAVAAAAPALHRSVAATPAVARSGRRGLPELSRLLDGSPPFLAELDPFLLSLNPALRHIADGRGSLISALANLSATTQASTIAAKSTEPLHYVRGMPVLSPMDLAPLSRRPGVNRTSAYPLNQPPDLAKGLNSYDTRHCDAPTPQVSTAPSPNIDDATRDQLAQYVYVPEANRVAAPPCKAQGPAGAFGTAFPVLRSDLLAAP